ncbi:hypothetical protein GGX14DRAFT_538211 [Mycena pura]|uniref:Uncharacterized protein n=1 Tax=Mycena pura TaxID=153505 RepID=A0AAD6URX6_9AGAR|nr:hypothetical protein GGX14DRAFT_538211 [Mycena pura]
MSSSTYDNVTTHRKCSAGALSARAMPKKKSKNPDPNFPAPVNMRNDDGSLMYDDHGKLLKENIHITGARFADGTVQDLYIHPRATKHAGKFKGMEILLDERRKKELKQKNTECKGFKRADPHLKSCCMRRMLFNQPDFAAVKSCLEDTCAEHNCAVLFLPNDCELNPIEMVPLESMRRLVLRAHRFADAYRHGLSGSQGAWVARKYKGHRVPPAEFLQEMRATGIEREGNRNAGL